MKAALAAVVGGWGLCAAAHADALWEAPGELGARGGARPAAGLVEATCELAVEIQGGAATVELRHRVENRGGAPLVAAYDLALPAEAALVGAAVGQDAEPPADALAVPVGFPTAVGGRPGALGPDPALIVATEVDARGHHGYRATLQPIAPGHAAVLTTRWAIAATIDHGALRVVLPGRASGRTLGACAGTVRAASGPGATVARIRVGASTTTGGVAAVTLGDDDVALDAELAFARPAPLVWTQRAPLGDGWAGELVTVLAPPARTAAPTARRALFLIDGSRSMQLVGAPAVARVVDAVAAALPVGTELDAIVYDRAAARVLGGWATADRAVGAIAAAVARHAPGNGTDLAAALRLARATVADDARVETALIVITDGVLGAPADTALVDALAPAGAALTVHAIVLDPGATRGPDKGALVRPVARFGGSYVEVAADDLDAALAGVEAWVRPAWVDLAVAGVPASARGELPSPLVAGAGGTRLFVTRGAAPTVTLDARSDTAVHVAAQSAAPGATRALALALSGPADFALGAGPTDADAALRARDRAIAAHPIVDGDHALVVLAGGSALARDRRALIAAGGPYTRLAAVPEPAWPLVAGPSPAAPSAIDRMTLARLFRDQLQPAAYACYQRALAAAPTLAGTVRFDLTLGRGEVTRVELEGTGQAPFDACLVDAAYRMTPPLPDLAVNSDDQTRVRYPLTFTLAEHRPVIVAGDADSSTPLDIDGIPGGVPTPGQAVRVDATSPLGPLAPR